MVAAGRKHAVALVSVKLNKSRPRSHATRRAASNIMSRWRSCAAATARDLVRADAALVSELGLSQYLARRLAVCGTPEDCLAQVHAAKTVGVRRLMLSVNLATDAVRTVQLFGERVVPAVKRQS